VGLKKAWVLSKRQQARHLPRSGLLEHPFEDLLRSKEASVALRANKDMMKKLRPQLIGLLTDSVIALTRQAADQGEEA